MMAPDSAHTPPPRMLAPETRSLLRDALSRFLDDASLTNGELRRVLHVVADEAREKHMRAEELVVAFKDVLDALPTGSSPAERLRRSRLREQLVSLCIKAYYGKD